MDRNEVSMSVVFGVICQCPDKDAIRYLHRVVQQPMPDSQFWCEEPQMRSLGGVRTAILPHGSRLKAVGWTVQLAGSEAQDHVCSLIIIIIILRLKWLLSGVWLCPMLTGSNLLL